MSQILEVSLREIMLSNSSFGPREIETISRIISEDYSEFGELREVVQILSGEDARTPASNVKLGVGLYMLGQYRLAAETLSNSDSGAIAFFYMGKSYFALNEFENAADAYESAAKAGYDKDLCMLGIVESHRHSGKTEEALRLVDDMFGPIEQTAEYLYQRGATIASIGNNPNEVIALYERAVEANPEHCGALFGLGLENDRRGNDGSAIEYYQRAANVFPTNVGTLLNLGVLYEDQERYDHAKRCYDRILDSFPTDKRALMFYKDAAASGETYSVENEREEERSRQVLKTPISDFELSVRSRNCLQRMGLNTLGDLTKISESELLGSKNFGETSLDEINKMMHSKQLSIGMYSDEVRPEEEPLDTTDLSPDAQALLDRPISDLQLSVRARKCMHRLELGTIGELLRRSPDDLLECKNFGVTSLKEIREKLTQMGLKLRGDDQR